MTRFVAPLLFALACGGADTTPAEPAPAAAEKPAPAPAPSEAATLKSAAPSPLQLDRDVSAAGLQTALAGLVPDRSFSMTEGSTDSAAVRTGVVLADAILAGPDTSKELFLRRLQEARAGLKRLGMKEGQGVLAQVDRFIKAVENETASRADFIQELDAIISMKVPEESWAPGDTTGPLLQAGAWLAGTNLVAQAVIKDGNAEAANKLLKEPEVVDFFIHYVQTEGASKAPDAVVGELLTTLGELKTVAEKPTLTVDDAKTVATATGRLLGQL